MQITHRSSGLWFVKQWQNICTETLKKVFSNAQKKGLRNIFRHFFHSIFFVFVLLISNHTVLLVQFGINLHLWVFQKAEIALAEAAISAFWKTHSCKLIPNWTRNHMISYTYFTDWCWSDSWPFTRGYPRVLVRIYMHNWKLDLISQSGWNTLTSA